MIDDMQVYIANLGKYNEGELVGDWFSFPLDEEVIAERIGLNAEYEEYAIHDTDNFPVLYPAMEVWKNWWNIRTTSFCIPAVKR